jgi:hypothetical protein
MKISTVQITCPLCGLPSARFTRIAPSGRLLNCELCGEFGIRTVDGADQYTELKTPWSREFYEALGRFVVGFAMAENAIDFACLAIFHNAGGSRLIKNLPTGLTKKLLFLRVAACELDTLQFRATDIIDALDRLDALVERRHHYVHGIYGTATAPQAFEKGKIDGAALVTTRLEATIASMREDETWAIAAGTLLLALCIQLADRASRN